MQAGTHLAAAVLTLSIARGFGLDVGPLEVGAVAVASLLPDIDTQSSGIGRYARPVSHFIETRFGHRTITHSLLFTAILCGLLFPLALYSPGVWYAFLYGYLSHLLLDTLNINGVPLLWPNPRQWWFFGSRRMRVPYGSPLEATLSVVFVFLALLLYPLGGDGFDTAFRRVVGTPETAVADYIDMRETHEVYAVLNGFNSQTQEPMHGRFRVVEAVGRNGIIVEDDSGRAYQVSKDGQVVAYRVRSYPGDPATVRAYRLDVGGRLLSDVLAALPQQQQTRAVWITGNLLLASDIEPPPAPVGTFPRIERQPGIQPVLLLHAARPADLMPYTSAFITSGSLVVRVEYSGQDAPDTLPLAPARAGRQTVRTVQLANLPSLAALLVQVGDEVQEGQPLARYTDEQTPAQHRETARLAREESARARAEAEQARIAFVQARTSVFRNITAARENVTKWEKLVSEGYATRLELEQKRGELAQLESRLTQATISYTSTSTRLSEREADARARAVASEEAARKAEAGQIVRSPVTGKVSEIRPGQTTNRGVTVDLVLVVSEAEQLKPEPGK